MIPDLRHLPAGFSPMQFLAAGVGTILKNWDLVLMIDGNDANVLGPLGQAKTRLGLWLSYAFAEALGIEFDMHRDLVIQDDLAHLYSLFPEFCQTCDIDSGNICAIHDLPLQVIMVDEAHWYLYNEWHAYNLVKALTPIFMSNRKRKRRVGEGDDAFGATVWILVTNLIWKTLEFFRESRINARFRMGGRLGEGRDLATCDVFLRAGALSNNPKTDSWGGIAVDRTPAGTVARAIQHTRWPDIPRVDGWVWDGYMRRFDDHVHEEERCVSRLRMGM